MGGRHREGAAGSHRDRSVTVLSRIWEFVTEPAAQAAMLVAVTIGVVLWLVW